MSAKLNPKDFGLPEVTLSSDCVVAYCRICKDSFNMYLWSDYFCPDCDIKRMAKVNAGFKEIERRMGVTSNERENK